MTLTYPLRFFVAAAVAAFLVGCGESSVKSNARVTVTSDFGQRTVMAGRSIELGPGATVMRQLQRISPIEAIYGGKYVKSIGGLGEGDSSGRSWIYFVDGVEPEIGATAWRLKHGDAVQWDFHRWLAVKGSGAIVGAFPRPLSSRSIRLECHPARSIACADTRKALDLAGVAEAQAQASGGSVVRLLVGPWSKLKGIDGVPDISSDPSQNGAFASITGTGTHARILTVNDEGEPAGELGPGAGLIAAFRDGSDVRWLVTGTNAAGVVRAAGALNSTTLGGKFAVAIDADDSVTALPVVTR